MEYIRDEDLLKYYDNPLYKNDEEVTEAVIKLVKLFIFDEDSKDI